MIKNLNQTKQTVIALIAEQQELLGISDHQLALAIGFTKSTVITGIKAGKILLPMSKISEVAAELSIDPAFFLRSYLEQTSPTTLELIDTLLIPPPLSANELKLIEAYRHLSKGNDVMPVIIDGCDVVALISV